MKIGKPMCFVMQVLLDRKKRPINQRSHTDDSQFADPMKVEGVRSRFPISLKKGPS